MHTCVHRCMNISLFSLLTQNEKIDGVQSLLNNVSRQCVSHTQAAPEAHYCCMTRCAICCTLPPLSLQERKVDTPDGPTHNVTGTAQYTYNDIHSEAHTEVS